MSAAASAVLALTPAAAAGPQALGSAASGPAGTARVRMTLTGQAQASQAGSALLEPQFTKAKVADALEQRLVLDARLAAARRARERAAARRQALRAARERAAQRQSASQAAQAPAPQQSPAQRAQPAPAAAASGTPQQIAISMLGSFGWPASQFSCLDPLWSHESGWNVYASNPGSGAYGIPQALPGSRMASAGPNWQSDAATQIRWGLGYIKGTYGSPCAAWAHEQATGWY
jgi:hypothetical protein